VKRNDLDELEAVEEIRAAPDPESAIADYVAKQLVRHIVVQVFHQAVRPKEGISLFELESLVAEVYPSTAAVSIHAYMNRILSWLQFTGLVDWEQPEQLIRPVGPGKDKGKVIIRRPKLIDGKAIFLCISSPNRTIDLAIQLCQERKLSRREILENSDRNAAQDLCALGLAQWKDTLLRPTGELVNVAESLEQDTRTQCTKIIEGCALESKFLKSLTNKMSDSPQRAGSAIIDAIAEELGRDWHPSSANRYLLGGRRWLEYFGKLQELRGQLCFLDSM